MAILPITIYGDKILSKIVDKVKAVDDELIVEIRDMFDTMRKADGVGLAANQVGLNKSFFIIDLQPVEGYENSKPLVFINPEILLYSDEEVIIDEGCLSLPNLRAEVSRPEAIKIKYLNTDEEEVELEADDFLARVILHEYDHLIGKTIPDRLSADVKKMLSDELKKIKNREVDISYPISKG